MRESTWLVVADGSRADLYCVSGPQLRPELECIDALVDGSVRERVAPGESGTHFAMSDIEGTRTEQQKRFIRRLVQRLKKSQQAGDFRGLYVAAPAGFIGKLRGLYGSALAHCVRREIVGDFTQVKSRDLEVRVRRWVN